MKRLAKIIFISISILLLSGCGSKKLTTKCTLDSDQSASGYKLESVYNIYSTNGIVDSVKTKEVVTSKNNTILSYFENILKSQYTKAGKAYGGYTFNVKKEDDKVTSEVTIDYNKMDLSKFVRDNASMKSYVNKSNKITLDGAKKIYESLGATCK